MEKTPTVMIAIRADPAVIAALDAWRSRQQAVPTRTAAIVAAIRLLTNAVVTEQQWRNK
jgi:hypothetical protein